MYPATIHGFATVLPSTVNSTPIQTAMPPRYVLRPPRIGGTPD